MKENVARKIQMVKGNRTCEEGATELVYQGREEGKDPETMVEEVELERCMHEQYCKSKCLK